MIELESIGGLVAVLVLLFVGLSLRNRWRSRQVFRRG